MLAPRPSRFAPILAFLAAAACEGGSTAEGPPGPDVRPTFDARVGDAAAPTDRPPLPGLDRGGGGTELDGGPLPPDASVDAPAPPADAAPPPADVAPTDASPGDLGLGGTLPPPDAALPPDAAAPPPDAAPPPPPPFITEVMARNSDGLEDEDGDHSDYLELYNPGAAPLSLAGWSLTDELDNPDKWTFPDVAMGPRQYLVVFASDKDRCEPGSELHTSFRLDADGEYVALMDPAGEVVQAFDAMPPQRQDVSWGLPAHATLRVLVDAQSPARALFPAPDEVPPAPEDFAASDYDDSAWREVRAAIGFDRTALPEAPLVLNDSIANFSGVQGQGGWTYGYRDTNAGADADFTPFPAEAWNGSAWNLPGDPPYTEVFAQGAHPNGRRAGGVHWAIRRWTASGPGRVRIRGVMGTYSLYGDGTRCRVLVDGREVLVKSVHNERKRYDVAVDVVVGTTVDFAVDPGLDGLEASDRTLFTARIELFDAGAADLGPKLADTVEDWSPTGGQGSRGWTSGYWARALDPDDMFQAEDFASFPRDEGPHGPTDFWNGAAWDWPGGDPPWTFLDADAAHPNGQDDGEQWVVRRWQCPVSGDLAIRWSVAKANAGGSGVTGHVFHNGAELDFADLEGRDQVGAERFVAAYAVQAGDVLDFALDPRGRGGLRDAGGDLSRLSAEIWQRGDLHTWLSSDVGAQMWDATSALLRVPFEIADAEALAEVLAHDRLRLLLHYDDGFEAWLNGVPVAAANTPEPGVGVTADRTAEAASDPVAFDLTPALGALRVGRNVLTLRGHQSPAADERFLLSPRLEAVRLDYRPLDPEAPVFLPLPTPGSDNVAPPEGVPPQVEILTPWPFVPAGDPLAILARVEPGTAPVERVFVVSKVMWGPEETSEMFDVGDATWQAFLFPQAFPGQLVRFRVEAVDATGARVRAPVFRDTDDSEAWTGTVVEDLSIESNLPVLHWFSGRPAGAASDQGAQSVIFWRGELYDNVRFSLHGQSSRGFPKHSFNVDFNDDHRFLVQEGVGRVKDVNLLSNYADKSKMRNTLAWETYRDSDADHHLAFPVRVQQNGQFHAVYDMVEDADDRWLDRLGRNPDGALYKMYDSLEDVGNGEKKTRRGEDKADLQALISALGADPDSVRRFVFDEVNLPAMTNFLAAMIITSSLDCCHKNYYAYRDTGVTDLWHYMIWDLDLSFGRNWTGGYFDDQLYPQNPLWVGGNNRLTRAFFAQPECTEMYLRRVRTLADRLVQPPDTPPEALHYEGRVDELFAEIGADGDLDNNAWATWGEPQTFAEAVRRLREDYLVPRRLFFYEQLVAERGGSLPEPVLEPTVILDESDPAPANPAEAYVRLTNLGGSAVDISDWRVNGAGVSRRLEPGTVIPAGGHLYVVADVKAFKARAAEPRGGMGLFLSGNWRGQLAADGTLPRLSTPEGAQVWP